VADDKTRLAHAVGDIIGYSWPCARQCRVHLPRATCQALGAHCHCLTLSYKTLGQTPFPRGRKSRKGSGKAGLSRNATQFFCRRRVLRSGGPNHVNHRVHHVYTERTIKKAKSLSRKRITVDRSGSSSDKSIVKPLRQPVLYAMYSLKIHLKTKPLCTQSHGQQTLLVLLTDIRVQSHTLTDCSCSIS
jgi:hypothetical protein